MHRVLNVAASVTTVSKSYMQELQTNSNGLEALFQMEKTKCTGILNGIDHDVWNPETDTYLKHHYAATTVTEGKQLNKAELCEQFQLDETKPLFVFIGRLVGEKAADVLPGAISAAIEQNKDNACFLILGSGIRKLSGS